MTVLDFESAAQFLLSHDRYTIVCHAAPDADTVGSAAALVLLLRKKGKTAAAFCPDAIPERLAVFAGDGIFTGDPERCDTLVSVDVATPAMLGNMRDLLPPFDLSIDHHTVNTVKCENLLIKSKYISNCEIIAALYDQLSVGIDREAAKPLYAGICSDSGGFRYMNTRPETMRLAARLMETGIDAPEICRQLFDRLSPATLALLKAAYNSVELFYGGKLAIVTVSREEFDESGATDADLDEVKSVPRRIAGVEVSALIRPNAQGTQVSLRSNDYFDVAAVCQSFGGGGHVRAAGFHIDGTPEQAREMLIKAFDGKL